MIMSCSLYAILGGAVPPYCYNAPPVSLDFNQCTPFILLTDDLINYTKR